MGEIAPIIKDLALILVLAGIVSMIFRRLRQPLVLGYIVAGFICSPHFPLFPSVVDVANVHTWADIGVVFLMFTLGLEFSFKKILKMGGMPFIAACTIIFCMIGLGSLAGHFFGWTRINSLFLGGMLAMSSTTVIYKALADMGLMQQRFASSVMSVLVVEDILGILLMVILSTLAVSANFEGMVLVGSLFQLLLVLVVWFLVGVFLIPSFLRRNRKWMSGETLLIMSLGLCFLMVVLAGKMHYSSAFGAFMMGSILAETIEAETINHLVEPVKDLFGAIFFVSVGMLVDPGVIVQYAVPILVLVVLIWVGQAIFGTCGYLLSGQPLKVAMQSGFSMAQIGEFAFIIASLGNSMNVTADFLYPVVVAVSVITTFSTPYMIRLAEPSYKYMERHLPASIRQLLETEGRLGEISTDKVWPRLMVTLTRQVVAYSFLSVAVIILSLHFLLPVSRHLLGHWWGNAFCGLITLAMVSPFLRAIVMRKNHSDDFKHLWNSGTFNRFPLVFTIVVRYIIASAFVFYIINYLSPYSTLLHWMIAFFLVLVFVASRSIKMGSIRLEHLFMRNLNSREILATARGRKAPRYADRLLSVDVHLTQVTLPMDSLYAGKTLQQLDLSRKEGVTVAAIYRKGKSVNIPGPKEMLYPGDVLQVIGDDNRLKAFAGHVNENIHPAVEPDENSEMVLRSLRVSAYSVFCNKRVRECGLREEWQCMLAGFLDEGSSQLSLPKAERIIREGDVMWIVGEKAMVELLMNKENM